MFIGGYDVTHAAMSGVGASATTKAVSAEIDAITQLQAAGAQHFLVAKVPDVGKTPLFVQEHPTFATEASALSMLYNQNLASELASLNGIDVVTFDPITYEKTILANASRFWHH